MNSELKLRVIEITELSQFDNILLNNKIVIVDFYAEWCGPCKKLKPLFHELSIKFPNIIFATVDIDNAQDIAEKCNISNLPTIMFYKEASNIEDIVGYCPDKLVQIINHLNI